MKKKIYLLLYVVMLISTIFLAIKIVMTYTLRGPFLLFFILTTVILGYWLLKMAIKIIHECQKK
jgi:hypothetical protein